MHFKNPVLVKLTVAHDRTDCDVSMKPVLWFSSGIIQTRRLSLHTTKEATSSKFKYLVYSYSLDLLPPNLGTNQTVRSVYLLINNQHTVSFLKLSKFFDPYPDMTTVKSEDARSFLPWPSVSH